MIIGLLSSPNPAERRVALIPAQVATLRQAGVDVLLEAGAGAGAGYADEAYRAAGARVVYDRMEALARPDIVVCPDRPRPAELEHLRQGATLMGLVHRFGGSQGWLRAAANAGLRVVALEEVTEASGQAPLRRRFAQIAGGLCPTIAGGLIQSGSGLGHGILLGAIPGFPSAEVVIIGAGALGRAAAQGFAGLGAQVTLMDTDLDALEQAEALPGRINTRLSGPANLRHALAFADVVVCCAAIIGQAAPRLLSAADLGAMRPGALLMDLAIDQGGNAETSRPVFDPRDAWIEAGIIHLSMPNIPSLAARTASKVFSATITPWLLGAAASDAGTLNALQRAVVALEPTPSEETP